MNVNMNNQSNEVKDTIRGLQAASHAAARFATQDYVGGALVVVSNIRPILIASIILIILPLLLIIMLPSILLSSAGSLIDEDAMNKTYEEIHSKVNSYFEDSYLNALQAANEKGKEKAEQYRGHYEISIVINSPYENNNYEEISNMETNEIMAIHGVLSQYDTSSEYNDITQTLWGSVDELDSSDNVYDRKFLKLVKVFAKSVYSVGDAVYTEIGTRTETMTKKDWFGNIVYHPETGEPVTEEITVHIGKVTVEIIREQNRFLETEIEDTKKLAWESYNQSVNEGYVIYINKTEDDVAKQIEDQISIMKKMMQLQFSPQSGSATTTGVVANRARTIKAFIGSQRYDKWKNNYVPETASLPYSNDVITSGYGWRVLYGKSDFHDAIDFAWGNCRLADIPSVADGVVVYAYGECTQDEEPSLGYGNLVIIYHGQKKGYDFFTLYGHCEKVYVITGQEVRAGQTIAGIGKRGNSTGYHLHFEVNVPTEGEIRALNPAEWLQSK